MVINVKGNTWLDFSAVFTEFLNKPPLYKGCLKFYVWIILIGLWPLLAIGGVNNKHVETLLDAVEDAVSSANTGWQQSTVAQRHVIDGALTTSKKNMLDW